jgi:chromatin structure-remodeling complex subunit RSC1/2
LVFFQLEVRLDGISFPQATPIVDLNITNPEVEDEDEKLNDDDIEEDEDDEEEEGDEDDDDDDGQSPQGQ